MRKILLAVLLILTSAAAFGQSALDQFVGTVKRKTLPNGLTVITRQTPGTGVVAINTWVKAGYFHEPDEVAGMAHLFEHMFFKGSKNFPGAEQISEELASVGGISNAGTIYDATNYYFVMPKEGFERGLAIQADAIANPLFDPAELKKEAEVVIEESNRKYDNAPAIALERMYATAFEKHRIKRWRIGSNEVLRAINRDNLLAFFETLYRPQNMIVVIVGDLTADEAFKAAEKTFGKLPKGTLTKKGGPAEPPQTAFRYGQSSADIRQSYTSAGWHTVRVGHKDELTLELLAQILGGGRSSRFFRNVVGPNGAAGAQAAHMTFEDVGLFQAMATFDEKNRAEVDKRLIQEIERIKAHGPTAAEMALARNVIEASNVLDLEDALGQAQALGGAEMRGGFRTLSTNLASLAKLTAKDVQDVAQRYLTLDNMTLYHYRPKGAPESTREAALQFVQQTIASTPNKPETDTAAHAAPAPVRGATTARPPQESKLSNGATLIVEERPGAPIVTAGVYFRGGRAYENSTNAGITQLMTRSMRRGTASRTAEQIDREIEFLGARVYTPMDRDYFGFGATAVSRNVRPTLALLADIVLNPTFPANGVNEEKHLQKAAIKRNADSAQLRPYQLFDEVYYRNHPYALPSEGYTTSVDAVDAAALRNWWSKNVVADDALVVIVGDIALDDAKQLAEESFAKIAKRNGPSPALELPVVPSQRAETVEFRDRKQSAIVIGFPGVAPSHPDWVRLRMLQSIAGGMAGTLFNELRSKRSLAYTVSAQNASAAQAGVFSGYLASDASKEEDARKGLLEELRRLGADAFGEKELARTKSYIAGVHRIQSESTQAKFSEHARNWFHGLGLDFTQRWLDAAQKLTEAEVKEAAKKYFGHDNYVTAVLRGKS